MSHTPLDIKSTKWTTLFTTKNPHQTEVTIDMTHIKMVDEEIDEVFTAIMYGKLNVMECKKVAEGMRYTYVSKENLRETFYVETNELDKLRQEKGSYTI